MPLGSWDHLDQKTRVTSRNSQKKTGLFHTFFLPVGGFLYLSEPSHFDKTELFFDDLFFHQPQGQGNGQASVTLSFVFSSTWAP